MTKSVLLRNKLAIPRIGLGTLQAKGQELTEAVRYALSIGIDHIDTALNYKNEKEIIEGLQSIPNSAKNCFLTSKIGPRFHGRDRAHEACEQILENLQMESIDLMLVHWPGVSGKSNSHPSLRQQRQNTWRVLESLHQQHILREIGVSNYETWHLEELLSYARVKPTVNQIEVHPRLPNSKLREFCAAHEIKVIAYSSLGKGELVTNPVVMEVAQNVQKTPAQVLLKWALQQDMLVIPKSVQKERIKEWSPSQMEGWELHNNHMNTLSTLEDNRRYCWNPSVVN